MGFRTSKFMTGMKSKNAFKTLSVAALAGVASLGATNSTMAQDVSVTPPLVDNTAFTLTPVEQASDNTITKYEYDSVTQTLTPTHYKLELNQMTLGEGDAQKAFQYIKDADGKMTLVDVTGQSDTVADLIVKYSSANVNTPVYTDTKTILEYVDSTLTSSPSVKKGLDVSSVLVNNVIGSTPISNTDSNNINVLAINNVISPEVSYNHAVLIVPSSTSSDITGVFIGNKNLVDENVYGSVLYTSGNDIGKISGDFIGNSSYGHYRVRGGVLSINNADVEGVSGNFYGNSANETPYEYGNYEIEVGGGAISSFNGHFKFINGKFYRNSVSSIKSETGGGALHLANTYVNDIDAEFVENNIVSDSPTAYGGALFLGRENHYSGHSVIETMKADFISNTAQSKSGDVFGGAFANSGTVSSLKGDFIKNSAKSEAGTVIGGALMNSGFNHFYHYHTEETLNATINSESNFVENYVESLADAYGGAIGNWSSAAFNYGIFFMQASIDNTGDLISNHATSTNGKALGGAVYTLGIDRNAVDDMIADMGGYGDIGDVSSLPYLELLILNDDGTVYKSLAVICDQNGNPVLGSALEDAIANGTLKSFVKMESSPITKTEFEALCEQEGMTEEEFLMTMEQMYGVAFVYGDPNDLLNKLPEDALPATIAHQTLKSARANKAGVTLKNSNILNNYALSQNGKAQGGAIYTEFDTVKIEANDGEAHLISGNYTKNGDVIDDNAIYAKDSKVIFDVTNGSTIQLDDNIDGENYETFIIGDQQSKFVLNNKIKNSTTHLVETNLYLTKDSHLDGNNLGLHSGTLHMINNQAGVSALNSLTVTGDTNINVDVDLKNQTMDRFTASEYGSHSGNLNVTGMNLLSDAIEDVTSIKFAETGLMDNVVNKANLEDKTYQSVAYTPIYKYNVSYDKRANDGGYFVFARSGGSSGAADSFNPAVLGSSSTATVGATATMNQAFNYAFQHSADHMNIPYLERISMRDRNKYALSVTGDATDMGRFSPLYQPSQEEASVWVKPYATFETVGLKNGPKVHNNTYGTLIGFDTQMQSLRRGWDRVFTGYIGYNGASQRYSGIDSTQNGGLLGGTMTLYKGNFFNATTVNVGASVASNQTMYGSENFAMLLSGIGNKTGYNFEFKEGKCILQPSLLMSYTFANTFDYTNAAGVRIDNKPLHVFQLVPGVKVIGNLKGGWQPYLSVSMIWNLIGESDATANGVRLPEMSIKPYVQYGVGVQKRIKDHFMGYGQAMVHNGGRNGVSLTAGFRWAIGHDNCKYEKTQRHPDKNQNLTMKQVQNGNKVATGKKIIKQMTHEQKVVYGGARQNTSRTASYGSLKRL